MAMQAANFFFIFCIFFLVKIGNSKLFDPSECGKSKGCTTFENGCDSNTAGSCVLLVSFQMDPTYKDSVLIELQSSSTSGVDGTNSAFNALGFSKTGEMVRSSVF